MAAEPVYRYRQIAADLEARIKRGEFKPGSRLPNERELAREYGAAKMTIARAVRLLRERGLVTTYIGLGHVVEGD